MYAMIATSVALSAWTAGLTYMIKRGKGRQVLEDSEINGEASKDEAGVKNKESIPYLGTKALYISESR